MTSQEFNPTVEVVGGDGWSNERVDVVVIGGGIIGVSAALSLREAGYSVALCEKGRIAGEQSSRNFGGVRKTKRDPLEIPLMLESIKLWESMSQRVGRPVGYRASGIVWLANTEKELAAYETFVREAGEFNLDARLLNFAELQKVLPGFEKVIPGALYSPSDGCAEPAVAAPAIAHAAHEKGARIYTNCAVHGIETSAGRVSGVVTEHGTIPCGSVLVAAGYWSRKILRPHGIDLPQLGVEASLSSSFAKARGPEPVISSPDFVARRRQDDTYLIGKFGSVVHEVGADSFRLLSRFMPALMGSGPDRARGNVKLRLGPKPITDLLFGDRPDQFERQRVLEPPHLESSAGTGKRNLDAAYPWFRDVKINQRWAGMIDMTPDELPVISDSTVPGLFIATGFSGHGFGIGPGAGQLAADLITGHTPIVDQHAFRMSRFD